MNLYIFPVNFFFITLQGRRSGGMIWGYRNFDMKYLIYIVILGMVAWWNPWGFNLTDVLFSPSEEEYSIPLDSTFDNSLLLPANQVITNEDSELELSGKFDQQIEKFIREWQLKGASFALMKDDKLIYSKGYGFANVEDSIPMDVMHIFRIASVSKLITAVGIMKLHEEGLLQLSDCVFGANGILNDSMYTDIKDARAYTITVEHLLRHQGGFSNAYGDPMFSPVIIAERMNVPPPADLNTIIRYVLSRRLSYTPGESTAYSNIGYGILSKVIEKISGEAYESFIRRQILYPAGCFDMHLGKNVYEEKLPNEVRYYEVSNAEKIPACDGSGKLVPRCYGGNNIEELYGAGGWVASPSELLRFLAAVDKDSRIPDILTPESIDYMTQKDSSNIMPIGWAETNTNGDWLRTGTLAGTSALMKRQANGYSWVFLTNTSSWKGARFTSNIHKAIDKAMTIVTGWPDRDLFEMQNTDYEKLLVIR